MRFFEHTPAWQSSPSSKPVETTHAIARVAVDGTQTSPVAHPHAGRPHTPPIAGTEQQPPTSLVPAYRCDGKSTHSPPLGQSPLPEQYFWHSPSTPQKYPGAQSLAFEQAAPEVPIPASTQSVAPAASLWQPKPAGHDSKGLLGLCGVTGSQTREHTLTPAITSWLGQVVGSYRFAPSTATHDVSSIQ